MRAAFLGQGLCVLALVTACDAAQPDRPVAEAPQAAAVPLGVPDPDHRGTPAPDVTFQTANGGPMALTAFRGTPTLVNLWATWCAPCVAELPALDRLAQAKGYDLNVVAVSQDIGGWNKIEPFLEQRPLEHLTVVADPDAGLGRAIGAAGLPVTILYDAEGKEVWRVNGPREWDEPGGLPPDPRRTDTSEQG